MKILVCIKEVPHIEAVPLINAEGTAFFYNRNESAFHINSSDEYALEEALLLKETIKGTSVDAVTSGTVDQIAVLRRALEMGADRAFILKMINHENVAEAFKTISSYAADKDYDLILTGVMSDDNMGFATGPSIAAELDYPWATSVISIQINLQNQTVTAERELDALSSEEVTLKLPALLTIQSGINRPRYPSLSNKIRARTTEIPVIEIPSPERSIKGTCISALKTPDIKKGSLRLEGTCRDKASALQRMLREKSLI